MRGKKFNCVEIHTFRRKFVVFMELHSKKISMIAGLLRADRMQRRENQMKKTRNGGRKQDERQEESGV